MLNSQFILVCRHKIPHIGAGICITLNYLPSALRFSTLFKGNLKMPFYKNSRYRNPKRLGEKQINICDNISDLHIKKRIQRNIKNMDQREKEIFCCLHEVRIHKSCCFIFTEG